MTLSLGLDLLMTCLLAGTIYYVLRLTQHLASFRNNRAEMMALIGQLNMAVASAQTAIHGLKSAAETSGTDLQKIIRSGTELADELQIMIEAGNNLASRLEQGAGEFNNNRSGQGASAPAVVPPPSSAMPPSARLSPAAPVGRASAGDEGLSPFNFAIRDPEFDESRAADDDDLQGTDDDFFMSDAERDLERALRAHQKTPRQVM